MQPSDFQPAQEAPPYPRRTYVLSAMACSLLLAIPFLSVTIPPITDLPQQTAQVRLLLETLGNEASPYEVQWLNPNKLGYAPLLTAWLATTPLAAGRVGLMLIGFLWIAALHYLAQSVRSPPAAAALATVFFFNHLTYWGLLNALIGLPVFVLWFSTIERLPTDRLDWRGGSRLLAVALLLYLTHILWLAVGLTWLAVATLTAKLPMQARIRCFGLRLAWVSPLLVGALAWYPQLQKSGFVSDTTWGRSPLGRLHPEWFLNSAFGGLEGRVEATLGLAIVGWLFLGLLMNWRKGRVRTRLLLAGAFFVGLSLCLPAVMQSTIFFASRWLPVGIVFLVLACPQPRLRPLLQNTVSFTILASLTLATTATWLAFEDQELDGLHESLAAVHPGSRVLGLDFVRTSERIKGYPFYHLYAYTQVMHGGQLSRSFANFGSSPVVFRDMPRKFPWTEGLDWRAKHLRRSDIEHFEYVIVYGRPPTHAPFLADERLTVVTAPRPWRLYRVGS